MQNQSSSPRAPVSVLIPVKNEQAHIAACLASVSWADEVVVIDSQSQDQTQELARSLGARIVQFQYTPGGPKKKNWALDNLDLRNDWVLILDADERITPALAAEIRSTLGQPGREVGYYLNRRFYFLNGWIRHCGYYPSWNLRLFRRTKGRYESFPGIDTASGDNEVHEHILLEGPAGRLASPMDHYAYLTIDQFLEKHARYANWEARLGRQAGAALSGEDPIQRRLGHRRWLKRLARALPCPHWARFFYHYFLRLGFLDGLRGYILSHLLAEYEFLIWAKRRELAALGTRSAASPHFAVKTGPH
jgi:glycosyltransferase involved in cell wall biosynthesis